MRFLEHHRRLITICCHALASVVVVVYSVFGTTLVVRAAGLPETNALVQPKLVKIYGAGGLRGLESYQSAFLISDSGHILTAWSYVLDTDDVVAVTYDGRKYSAELVGADPATELAVLKIDATATPHFNLQEAAHLNLGDRILAFSNLYGIAAGNEPASLQLGHVSAITTLTARRGAYETLYRGPVYVVDAMTNNAGAAGGALTDLHGNLAGILGKELRDARSNLWLNYAIPVPEITDVVADILAGKTRRRPDNELRKPDQPLTLSLLGIVLVPDVLQKTPPFIERVRTGSPAERSQLRPDDLVVFVGTNVVQSCKEVVEELTFIDRIDPVQITVLRDNELVLVELAAGK